MEEFEDLFNDSALDNTMSFLDEKKVSKTADGLYRIDMTKVKDKKRGYRAELRFLPNMTENPELVKKYLGDRWTEDAEMAVGPSAIEKVSHYVNIRQLPELKGYYDSPKNFGEKCVLTDTYYALINSKNALLMEKAKMLNYTKKYLSYVLVMKDEQQPEYEGKILVFQYGKQIKDEISAERNGEITGEPCNIFNLQSGKDFRLIVKEIDTGDATFPDYKMSGFKESPSSISLPTQDGFKNIPLEDGKIPANLQGKVKDFLAKREVELEEFGPRALTEEQQEKVSQIVAYLTGNSSGAGTSTSTNEASAEDFTFDDDDYETEEAPSGSDEASEFDFDFE